MSAGADWHSGNSRQQDAEHDRIALMKVGSIQFDPQQIKDFCHKWRIREFALFGSVLRDDFTPESDVDVLVSFHPETFWGFEIQDMEQELEAMFGRKVDFVLKDGLRNPFRRHAILNSRKVIYAA